MGIRNEVICCYGVEYSYEEIKHIRGSEEYKRVSEEIGCENMVNVWVELGNIACNEYYDQEEEYYRYIIGEEMRTEMGKRELKDLEGRAEEVEERIRERCEKYKLEYREAKLICRVNVS